MPIYQINVFICEVCDKIQNKTEEVNYVRVNDNGSCTKVILYDDSGGFPENKEWYYKHKDGKVLLMCPDCFREFERNK